MWIVRERISRKGFPFPDMSDSREELWLQLFASCLYEAFVYLAVKQKSTFVGRKTKDKVLAMGRKARQGKATLFIVLAIVCFVLMIVAGILMAHAGYSV